ncbi:ATP binding [Ascochyta rabiei]|uniref:ATP binding n=1 Tax=Didymella rabiei TaxID=5454 RepID=A0A163CPK6_DIDRA|nr:ATP binding [Ascochyta rabiei]
MQKKRIDSATNQSRDGPKAKRRRRESHPMPFTFYPEDWAIERAFDAKVSLLRSRSDCARPQLIVKKVLKIEPNSANDPKPFETRVLALLPRCNRVVHALTCVASDDPKVGIALFDYYPLGDLAVWKERKFDLKNHKPVPESFIWRFFLQMAQALAFIHNCIGPGREGRHPLLHRDMKPKNVLVVDIGTTYMSFKLHDFGCASVWQEEKQNQKSYCGTFDWQPPENPRINTMAADIWALGACVHFLATGKKPVADAKEYRAARLDRAKESPPRYCKPGLLQLPVQRRA